MPGLDFAVTIAEESANGTSVGSVSASDVDLPGDTLTYSISGGDPLNGFSVDASGNITILDASVLDLDFDDGTDLVTTLTITVDDGTLNDTVDVTVRVTPVNDAPILTNTGATLDEGGTVLLDTELAATDVDNTPLQLIYTITTVPANGFVALNTNPLVPITSFTQANIDAGQLIYVHDGSETSTDQFFFDLSDSSGATVTGQRFDLSVNPVNDAPVANSDSTNVDEDQTLTGSSILANDVDPDNAILTTQLVTGPSNAELFVLNSDGTFVYAPSENFNGTDSFQYVSNDGLLSSNIATVTITVNSVNDLPEGKADQFTLITGSVLRELSGVLTNDLDVENDALVAILIGNPANGTVSLFSNGSFEYTPDIGFFGTDTFTYLPNDGSGNGTATTVSIEVVVVNGNESTDKTNNGAFVPEDEHGDQEDPLEESTNESTKPVQLPTPKPEVSFGHSRDQTVVNNHSDAATLDGLLGTQGAYDNLPNQQQAIDILEWMSANQSIVNRIADIDDSIPADGISFAFKASQLWENLDRLSDEVSDNISFGLASPALIAITTITATAGYVIWSLRGGFLMATLISSLPAWSHIDPLPVLESSSLKRQKRSTDAADQLFEGVK